MKDTPRSYKSMGYPVIPMIFVLFCITLVVVTIIQNPLDAGIGLGLMISRIPFIFSGTGRKHRNKSVF